MIILFAMVFSCTKDKGSVLSVPIPHTIISEPEPQKIQEDYLTFIAAGDNLFHNELYESSFKDDVYQFDPIYEEIKSFIEPADIAFINQETLLAGKDFEYSSYPQFNTPQELGSTLQKVGFDVVSHANNHVMDKGSKATIATVNFWNTIPNVKVLGIHASQESRNDNYVIIEKNNIKVGFLAYTCSTNYLAVPKDMPYLVSLADKEIMAKEIDALRPLCDVLIVSMHWGNEYEHMQNTDQETWSSFLAEHNADIIIGHHPHVLQPYEYIERADGKRMLCYYSLGNFVSGQDEAPRMLGGLAYIKIKKAETEISIEQAGIIPVMTHYSTSLDGFKVYPLHSYTEELLSQHWIKWKVKDINLEYFNSIVDDVFEDEVIKYNPFTINND
jgi:poly-gamma-glutamate synthesis protein (capsule biosynthesis protein)